MEGKEALEDAVQQSRVHIAEADGRVEKHDLHGSPEGLDHRIPQSDVGLINLALALDLLIAGELP